MAFALAVLVVTVSCAWAAPADARVIGPGDPSYPQEYKVTGTFAVANGAVDVFVRGDATVSASDGTAGFAAASTHPNALPGDVIAVAVNFGRPNGAVNPRPVGLVAEVLINDVSYVTNNQTGDWKCTSAASNAPPSGWKAAKFDDSKWLPPLELEPNTNDLNLVPRPSWLDGAVHPMGISKKAFWIWANDAPLMPGAHPFLWCRFTVPGAAPPHTGAQAVPAPAPAPAAPTPAPSAGGDRDRSSSHTTITPLPAGTGGGYAYRERTVTHIPVKPSRPAHPAPAHTPGSSSSSSSSSSSEFPGMREYPGGEPTYPGTVTWYPDRDNAPPYVPPSERHRRRP